MEMLVNPTGAEGFWLRILGIMLVLGIVGYVWCIGKRRR